MKNLYLFLILTITSFLLNSCHDSSLVQNPYQITVENTDDHSTYTGHLDHGVWKWDDDAPPVYVLIDQLSKDGISYTIYNQDLDHEAECGKAFYLQEKDEQGHWRSMIEFLFGIGEEENFSWEEEGYPIRSNESMSFRYVFSVPSDWDFHGEYRFITRVNLEVMAVKFEDYQIEISFSK